MILQQLFESADTAKFGGNYAEQLAQEVFDHSPDLDNEDAVLNLGYNMSKSDLGSRASGIFRDADFPGDFVSAYYHLQKQGVAEAGPYGSRNPDTMSPSDYDRYQQDQMDYSKRDFKRREHDAEWEQEKAYSAKLAARDSGNWYVRINGKIVKDKQGNPYTFNGKAAANKAALTMQAKPFNQGKQFMLTTNPADVTQGVAEGSNVDSQIKRIKDRILQLKDWNTAGTHDKKIKELQARLKELQQQKQGVAEGEQRMSRAAKGNEKYGKDGMKALAKAGRDGAGEEKLDKIRDKYDKYDDKVNEAADLTESKISYKPKHRRL